MYYSVPKHICNLYPFTLPNLSHFFVLSLDIFCILSLVSKVPKGIVTVFLKYILPSY